MLKIGDRVMVLNESISGKDIEEGKATIHEVCGEGEYQVLFDVDAPDAPWCSTYRRRITDDQKLAE